MVTLNGNCQLFGTSLPIMGRKISNTIKGRVYYKHFHTKCRTSQGNIATNVARKNVTHFARTGKKRGIQLFKS